MVGGDAGAEDQVVERDAYAVVADDLLRVVVDAGDGGPAEVDPAVPGGVVAQRVGDVAGVQAAGRHLVEQRLERVVRVPVDQGDPEPLLGQLAGRRDPGEAPAHHHDMRHLAHVINLTSEAVGQPLHPRLHVEGDGAGRAQRDAVRVQLDRCRVGHNAAPLQH